MTSSQKVKIVFTLPCREGGVASIVRNIIEYIDKTDLYIKVVLIKNKSDKHSFEPKCFSANETTLFEYSYLDNKYYVYTRFVNLIPYDALLIVNDYFTPKVVNALKLNNKLIYICHTSYEEEFNSIKQIKNVVTHFIAVSNYNKKKIEEISEKISVEKIFHPIPNIWKKRTKNQSEPLRIIFVGRFFKDKGIFDIPQIDTLLKKQNIPIKWTMVGFGPDELQFKQQFNKKEGVVWLGKIDNEKLTEIYAQNDIFILPSHSEGFPTVLVEAMKSGLVPLVSDLPSGIPELIKHGENGYIFPIETPDLYANTIIYLNNERNLLDKLSENAYTKVKEMFNPVLQAEKYKNSIIHILNMKNEDRVFTKEKYGVLDLPFLPNLFVRSIRFFLRRN